ncbi:LPS export ABC transporter ATP-binding protein [Longibacter salinarum]|uniref:LPS export ABC transporter ATP-binding protein n=1 Tax=Longibacter salinarum TaxID=1850348 RepID=A0A2A8D3A3_9BACT|nr:LPS export ABC transporter ATP-binding protein [Longibacter salinarum]PEN15297.1 LPS export ABC transporter ATP-binding protein [Longibacter salinarum]
MSDSAPSNTETSPKVAPESEPTVAQRSIPDDPIVLSAEHLTKRYKKRAVVKDVSLRVQQGEIVGLLGPNGAGKTTTFHMIVGMIRPNEGRIVLGGDDVTRLPMYKRARRGVGYLAQETSVFRELSVEDNLHAVLEFQPISAQERKARVEALIREFGLDRVRESKGYALSGGERRRTEIARALATRPQFFLLDEPFAGVDPIAVEDIQSIVAGLKERGIGVLITDHNVHETLAITDRAYLLYEGDILKAGTAEELAADPEVRKRYLGEKFTLDRY